MSMNDYIPKPMNGTKTHPLTKVAVETLRELARRPAPTQSINAGLVNRFHREQLVDVVMLPSPYATHKGKDIQHMQTNAAGLKAIEESKHR